MRRVLQILTRPAEAPWEKVLLDQQQLPGHAITRVDLSTLSPDYDQLLDAIFAADCIEVW